MLACQRKFQDIATNVTLGSDACQDLDFAEELNLPHCGTCGKRKFEYDQPIIPLSF